jgi:beta-fructofuranosidase
VAHFAPASNWMNDPNGLIFWEGWYHLFYQYNPLSTAHHRPCWGHARSTDLVHWEDMPVALEPTPGSVDEDGCWSGRAVVHDGQVHILYTAYRAGRQRPCLARALRPDLARFEKFTGNPVIREEPGPGLAGFRDCAVWQGPDGFHQLIGSGSVELGGCVLEYLSTDLVHWGYKGILLSGVEAGISGNMWECPDFFRIGDRWYLVVSVMEDSEPSRAMCVTGRMQDGRFGVEHIGRVDTGPRWYAPQSFDAPGGRRVVLAWLREREEELPAEERGRVGVMSLPREFYATAEGSLGMRPVGELELLRSRTPDELRTGADGDVLARHAHAAGALEVELSWPDRGQAQVELLDRLGAAIVSVVADEGGISVVGPGTLPPHARAVVGQRPWRGPLSCWARPTVRQGAQSLLRRGDLRGVQPDG